MLVLLSPGSTHGDEVGPREVPDDTGGGADPHVADDGEQPPAKEQGTSGGGFVPAHTEGPRHR